MEVSDKFQAPCHVIFWEKLVLDTDQMYLTASEGVLE